MDSTASLWDIGEAGTVLMIWLLGSVSINALATNALRFVEGSHSWQRFYRGWVWEGARFLYFVGIPYLALGGWPQGPNRGLLSLGDMGIVGLDAIWPVTRWLQAAGAGLGWGLTVLVFLVLSWVSANRHAGGRLLSFSARPWWSVLVDVLYLQIHWAFYRGILTLVTGDPYAGTFVGLGLVYLEWLLNPFWRQGWREQSVVATLWLRSAMALVIAVAFFLSRNLWICLLVHGVLEFAMRQLGRGNSRRIASDPLH
jgi:hypothetical protein